MAKNTKVCDYRRMLENMASLMLARCSADAVNFYCAAIAEAYGKDAHQVFDDCKALLYECI